MSEYFLLISSKDFAMFM